MKTNKKINWLAAVFVTAVAAFLPATGKADPQSYQWMPVPANMLSLSNSTVYVWQTNSWQNTVSGTFTSTGAGAVPIPPGASLVYYPVFQGTGSETNAVTVGLDLTCAGTLSSYFSTTEPYSVSVQLNGTNIVIGRATTGGTVLLGDNAVRIGSCSTAATNATFLGMLIGFKTLNPY